MCTGSCRLSHLRPQRPGSAALRVGRSAPCSITEPAPAPCSCCRHLQVKRLTCLSADYPTICTLAPSQLRWQRPPPAAAAAHGAPVCYLHLPLVHVQLLAVLAEAQHAQDGAVRVLALHQQGDAPDVADVVHRQHALRRHLAEQRLQAATAHSAVADGRDNEQSAPQGWNLGDHLPFIPPAAARQGSAHVTTSPATQPAAASTCVSCWRSLAVFSPAFAAQSRPVARCTCRPAGLGAGPGCAAPPHCAAWAWSSAHQPRR